VPDPAASRLGREWPVRRFAALSILAALLTIGMKMTAWRITGSVGLLSDAVESLVNLAGAVMAFGMLTVAAKPADERHAFGHSKAEYFSSGFEGMLVILAAVSIGYAAVGRLASPAGLQQVGLGLGFSVLASLVNLGVAIIIGRAGRRYGSITLQADSQHLLTDVWTSAGVLAGVAAVALTGWRLLDPIVALAVACNIVFTGIRIVRESASGLMDAALPRPELQIVEGILDGHRRNGIEFHDVMTRLSGRTRYISLHALVPGDWTVRRGHDALDLVEADLAAALPGAVVFTHLESRGGDAVAT